MVGPYAALTVVLRYEGDMNGYPGPYQVSGLRLILGHGYARASAQQMEEQ